MNKKQKKTLIRIIVTSIMMIVLHFIPAEGALRLLLYALPYFLIGHDILIKAAKNIKNGQVFDENFLMTVATVGALALAIYEKSGDYDEAIAVMLFYQIGEWFQSYAVGKSRKNISELMDIRPDYANIERDGELLRVSPDELDVGSVIVVQPGERIPIDGIVLEGVSILDTSALTGEALPRSARPGDSVQSGCINTNAVIKIRTTKKFEESTASRILDLVENAGSNKSQSEQFITKFARIYTPVVCGCALALALLPPILGLLFASEPGWGVWIYRALTFLVISCPCALVISIPLSFFAGIGGASNAGILIKGSNHLETLAKTDTVVFDKTGTLTKGIFKVIAVHHNVLNEAKLIEYAALAEVASSHPISRSIQNAYNHHLDRSRVSDIEEISGEGVKAVVDGHPVAVGNAKLMASMGIEAIACHAIGTIAHVAIDGKYAGHIVISDIIKKHSKEAVSALKDVGVRKTVMLTGDMKPISDSVAGQIGIDEAYSQLLPQDKVEKLEQLLAEEAANRSLAFVGDGINDAPVLTRADVGIAMGAMGSDAAIEAADVVLMDDDPLKIAKAVKIAKKCIRIVNENIVFAIGIKLICLVLGAFGIADMWLAIFADVGVMILAVLNAIRALFVKRL